jgi:hypothetical protein
MWLVLSLACDPGEIPNCGAGFTLRDDLCYQDPVDTPEDTDVPTDEPATLDDVLADLPPCTSDSGDGDLDFLDACASGVCADMTLAEMEDVLGPGECVTLGMDFGGFLYSFVSCDWLKRTISADFDDVDADGLADADAVAGSLSLGVGYNHETADGLGLGPVSCFVQRLGDPATIGFSATAAGWVVSNVSYDRPNIYVTDYQDNETLAPVPDGLADGITLYGP